MAHISKEFGERVSKVLAERGWSYQRACVASGIPGATIGRMAIGIVPGEGHVIKWAKILHEPVNEWLVLAGYEPIPVELCLPKGTPHEVREDIMRLLKNAGVL